MGRIIQARIDGYQKFLESLGAKISEGNDSRVCIELKGERAVFHTPHPEKVTDKGAVKSMRKFLDNAEVKDDDL